MPWTASLLSFLTAGAVLVTIVVGIAAWRRRPDPMAVPIVLLMTAVALWAAPQALSYALTYPALVIAFHQLSYAGTVFTLFTLYVFAFRYTNRDWWLRRDVFVVLGIVPTITLVVVATASQHDIFWTGVTVERMMGASVTVLEYGPWFWVHLLWAYGLAVASVFAIGREAVRSDPLHRKQTILVLFAVLLPLGLNVSHIVGIGPPAEIDLTPVALAISGVVFALAFFVFDLMELRPVGRDRMLDQLPDGVIIVGPSGRIRDFNATGAAIVDALRSPTDPNEELPATLATERIELSVAIDGEPRQFRGKYQIFEDRGGEEVGRLIYLRDITGITRREQRISVLNRVLRHNIRTEVTILLGHLERLRDRVRESDREFVEGIARSTDRILSHAEKARHIERTLQQRDHTETVEIADVIDSAIERVSERYPGALVRYERHRANGCTKASVIDSDLVEQAIFELLENALIHGKGPNSTVEATIESSGGGASVSIIDEGEGIPDAEIVALEGSVETALNHGSGVGLWLVRWTADLCAGELRFGRNGDRNVVRLDLPCDACARLG